MTPIEQQIEGIVDNILEDYRNGRDIDKLDPFQHPDKAVVIDMIGKLMRIVYPGSSRDKTYRIYNARHNLSMLIEDVMYNLNKQIAVVLQSTMEPEAAQARAQEVSLAFFRAIPGAPATWLIRPKLLTRWASTWPIPASPSWPSPRRRSTAT